MTTKMTYPGHARAIAVIGLPLVGGHLGQVAIGVTDTVMVGWYSVEALAAVTLASTYFFVLLICMACILMMARLVHSPYGRIIAAIRDSEPRAISLGYNVNRYKLAVFVFSAGVTGLAGATKAIAVQIASLTDVAWHMSGEFVLMTLVGGLGTIVGPVLGALTLIGMETYMAELRDWVTVAQGVVFFVVVLSFRQGIVGTFTSVRERLFPDAVQK
ncbi:hypothetical protein [Hydrogenophaga sp.]|uniref:branched-chain amino acid ABC transporter permease n=1 Tax=Hydrogenophaga sp. TaxID=1904254 RepID=UPI00356908CA